MFGTGVYAGAVREAVYEAGKNDAADTEAICEAMTRPTMRFVAIKSHGSGPPACRRHGIGCRHRLGYQAAVLSLLAQSVVSIEIVAPLAHAVAKRLRRLDYRNVTVIAGDRFARLIDRAPFGANIVAAGATAIPPALIEQFKPGGRLVMPVGPSQYREQLILVTKAPDGSLTQCSLGPPPSCRSPVQRWREPVAPVPLEALPLCYGVPVT